MLRVRLGRISQEQSGFTLIELLVVGLILIILSVLALPVYASATDKSRVSVSYTRMKRISEALELYRSDPGHANYPTSLGELVQDGYIRREYLETPWSKPDRPLYYFYAFDRFNKTELPLGYALGDPGPRPTSGCDGEGSATLKPEGEALPCGRHPDSLAWHFGPGQGDGYLNLPTFPSKDCRTEVTTPTYTYYTLRGCRNDLFTES